MPTFFSQYEAYTIFNVFVDGLQIIYINVAISGRNIIFSSYIVSWRSQYTTYFRCRYKSSRTALIMENREITKPDWLSTFHGLV